MIQVNVTPINSSNVAFSSQFATQDLANAWIAQCEASNMWGLSAGTYPQYMLTTEQLATQTAIQTTDTSGLPLVVPLVTIPAQYTVSQVDITAQVAQQASVQKGLQAQQIGAQVVATVYAYNEANLASGALTSTQFNAMLADTTINNIERLLWNGSLATALALMQSYNTTLLTYFTSAQIAAIEAVITNSGLL